MEMEDNQDIDVCDEIMNNAYPGQVGVCKNNDQDISSKKESVFLSASELFMLRKDICKNKDKDENVDANKGPKLYAPSDSSQEKETMENLLSNHKKSLKLSRGAKIRDCVKGEWNEELKVAIVPHLKGKSTQHMGHNFKGKIALTPEETLFLLEKNCVEVNRKNVPMSIEEAFTILLKERLSLEKYQVYSHLSQQGFIVVKHQTRIGPRYEEVMNINRQKQKKRKASDLKADEPREKRLTFTGVLASNVEPNVTVNAEESIVSSDCEVLNNSDSLNKTDILPEESSSFDIGKATDNVVNINEMLVSVSSQNKTVLPDSTNEIESMDLKDKDSLKITSGVIEPTNEAKTVSDKLVSSLDSQKQNIPDADEVAVKALVNTDVLKVVDTQRDNSDIEAYGIEIATNINEKEETCDAFIKLSENVAAVGTVEDLDGKDANSINKKSNDKNEIEMENANDEANEIIIDSSHEFDKNDNINVDESLSNYNHEYSASEESLSLVCEESSEELSVDVLSCSSSDQLSTFDAINSQSSDIYVPKDHDDEVKLIEVKKKEKKPLAVIDLLSDDEQEEDKNKETAFEGSDDEVQVIEVRPVVKSHAQSSSRNLNSIKSECKSETTPIKSSADIKSSFRPQMKFPDMFRKDVLCLPRPPANFLPNHVRPAKEAYVINRNKSVQPNKGRLWNSFRDMQDYQRERRERHSNNSRPFNSLRDFRFQNELHNNRGTPFNRQENSRDMGFDRNNQNYGFQQTASPFNVPAPMTPLVRGSSLLPSPDVFTTPNRLPFVNIPSLHNLSSTNPVAFMNELQKTVYSVASSMLTSMMGQHVNPMNPAARNSPTLNEPPFMGHNSHNQYNNFAFSSPMVQDHTAFNTNSASDFQPVRFPPEPMFSGERFPYSRNRAPMFENNWRSNDFRPRNFERKGPLFPCPYREVRRKRCWNDVKAAVEGSNANMSDSGSDIEEVPINLNQFLWSNDIQPLVKPGSKLPVLEVLQKLRITQMANLLDKNRNIEKYMPEASSLEISFDVYLPGSKYKKTAPGVPKHRIVVLRASDPIPKYSELVVLQRKWNDGAVLQMAIVDHSDISFYSFNSVDLNTLMPHEE